MATFDQNITTIRQAQYGYEVRDAIAEGLTQCYNKPLYRTLEYEESDTAGVGKKIEIFLPDDKKVLIYTSVSKSNNYYASVGSTVVTTSASCYYANSIANPTCTITKNLNDGSIIVTLSSELSYITRTTKIRVGYDAIETSLLVTSSSQYSGGSSNFAEIILNRVSYSGGFSASGSTWYPGTITNPNYIPLVMTNFGGPGECLTSVSSVPTSFDGHNLYSDLSSGGRTGSHFYTKFVYS